MSSSKAWRKTSQELLPLHHASMPVGQYDVYPGFDIGSGKIFSGYDTLADQLIGHSQVIIDGYGGVLWDTFHEQLDQILAQRGITVAWFNINDALRPTNEIETMVAPFLGGSDPLFGTRFTEHLADFFDAEKLRDLRPAADVVLNIIYGCGAALSGWDGLLIYIDIPKNEIQFRARAEAITNLACAQANTPQMMYKRFYFVDWVALNRHKADLLSRIDWVIDGQRPDVPVLIAGSDFLAALETMSHNYFRVRPWFEPGPWGGQWIKQYLSQLAQDVPNYAWSFELIVPENGLLLESDTLLLEVSFDFIMYYDNRSILGQCADRFGYEFPVRFDFLDTFDGGNLSLQCHPRPDYARHHFGENFTQDETYYILDCAPDAKVYLGFREDIDADAFRQALEDSYTRSVPVEVERFVTIEPAHRHDLFLIPSGTIHCSGINNLVLEISATPYIFTFKLYDWLRLGMDGKPRPLNIARAFENLNFERKGDKAHRELVSRPSVLSEGDGWQIVHVPTHPEHFYDVHRLEFTQQLEVETGNSFNILSLVEGQSIILETAVGIRQRFNYAETFVVPASAGHYRLINEGSNPVKVIRCFMKSRL